MKGNCFTWEIIEEIDIKPDKKHLPIRKKKNVKLKQN